MELIISIIALAVSLITAFIVYKLKTTVLVNMYNMSKGLDVLWENQQKIVELTKIKGFVSLVSAEQDKIHKEIQAEKTNPVKKQSPPSSSL
jgi:hypothetical protein